MKYAFLVKHNGKTYLPGQEVPIGKETRSDLPLDKLTPTEISKVLKDKYGVEMPVQKGKNKLLEAVKKAEEDAKAKAKEEAEAAKGNTNQGNPEDADDESNANGDSEESEFLKNSLNDDEQSEDKE